MKHPVKQLTNTSILKYINQNRDKIRRFQSAHPLIKSEPNPDIRNMNVFREKDNTSLSRK